MFKNILNLNDNKNYINKNERFESWKLLEDMFLSIIKKLVYLFFNHLGSFVQNSYE